MFPNFFEEFPYLHLIVDLRFRFDYNNIIKWKRKDGDNAMDIKNSPEIKLHSVIFRDRLAQLIREKGLTLTDIRDKLGVTRATISRYLTGLRAPDFEHLLALAIFFDVSLDWLTGRDINSNLTQKEKNIVASYNKASDNDRKLIDLMLSKYED